MPTHSLQQVQVSELFLPSKFAYTLDLEQLGVISQESKGSIKASFGASTQAAHRAHESARGRAKRHQLNVDISLEQPYRGILASPFSEWVAPEEWSRGLALAFSLVL